MKKTASIILFLMSAQIVFSADRNVDSILVVLDNTILHKRAFHQAKELELSLMKIKLDSSHTPAEFLANSLELSSSYFSYQNDSAMHYVLLARDRAISIGDRKRYVESEIMRANICRAMGQFIESSKLLKNLNTRDIPEEMRYKYWNSIRLVCNALRGYSASALEKNVYESSARLYRDSLISDPLTPSVLKFLVELERLYMNGEFEAGMKLVSEKYDTISAKDLGKDPGIINFYIADLYGYKGDHNSELYFLAKAAIEDISHASRGYASLRKLSRYLYQSEDVDRAYNYMKCHIDDAVTSNERFRLFESVSMFLDINKTFQTKELKQKRSIAVIMSLLVVVTILLILAVFRMARQKMLADSARENESRSNMTLAKINNRLEDANRIKVEYIRLYMEQHLNYLSKIESYKKKARKIALVEGTQMLLDFVESSMTTKNEFDNFYKHFDATILSLFPDFIAGFNALLDPDKQEILKNSRTLSPGLRIFALIRLGITNSMDISRFLQYSLSTIYSYRTRMRNRATDRDGFEKQVMKIGINTQ